MPPDIVTVWDGTRQRDPYLGMIWEPPRPAPPPEGRGPEIPALRCSVAAFEDLIVATLQARPMTFAELGTALCGVHRTDQRVFNRLHNAIRRLKYRHAVAIVGAQEQPAGNRTRV